MLKRCLKCRTLTDNGSYCPRCGPKWPASPGRDRGPAWQRLRAQVIEAQGGLCARCGKAKPLQAHHLDRNFRHNTAENLTAVCVSCHRWIERH